jgi:hypothetical protein
MNYSAMCSPNTVSFFSQAHKNVGRSKPGVWKNFYAVPFILSHCLVREEGKALQGSKHTGTMEHPLGSLNEGIQQRQLC